MSNLAPRIAFPMLLLTVLADSTFLVAAEPTSHPNPKTATKPSGWGIRQVLVADPKLPHVLLIGDSILNGYHAKAADLLRGKVSLDVWVTPKHIGSKDLPADMKAIFAEHIYDLVLFNDIGLHAWEPGRIPEGQYEPLLRAHLANLRKFAPKTKLIFASTTPMTTKTKPIALDPEYNPLIVERNKIATKVMAENQVPVADYYGILATKLELAAGDRFHWTKPAYELLAQSAAKQVVQAMTRSLPATADPPVGKPRAVKQPRPKAVDPTLEPIEDVTGLPRVLLIGDSISMGYTLPVRELLKGKANVHRPPTNCSSTASGLKKLDAWLGQGKWDVIHFNFGLHDLKYLDERGSYVGPDKGKQLVPPAVYEQNLRKVVERLKKTGAKLIWCSTTPVPEGSLGRVKGDELKYNQIAARIMAENDVAMDDLHAVASAKAAEIQLPKNVHFTKDGYQYLAAAVVKSIETALGK